MEPDLVGILESIYRLEQATPSWIGGILERLSPWVDVGLGLFGFIYTVSPAGELLQDSFASRGCSPEMLRTLPYAAAQLEPEYVRRSYLTVDAAAASEIPGWRESRSAAHAKRESPATRGNRQFGHRNAIDDLHGLRIAKIDALLVGLDSGQHVAPGVYLYLVRADGQSKSAKAIIIR